MSGSSGTSAQRRARLAAKRQTLMMMNVTEEQVYKYALRAGYAAFLLDPATQAKLHPPSPVAPSMPKQSQSQKHLSSLTGASKPFGFLDLLGDSSSKDTKANKFPKELVQILRDKLQSIFMGRDPKYQDHLIRATFGAYFNQYVDPNYLKQLKENRKIEEVVLIFYSKATAELKKRTTDEEWRYLVDQHVATFIRVIQDCMKEHHLAATAPELMTRLAGYEAKLLSEAKETLEPEGPAKEDNAPEVNFSVKDMDIVMTLGHIFQKPEGALQRDIDHIRVLASEQSVLQDLKNYTKDLNNASPPSLRPSDFPDEASYDDWKFSESKIISDIMVNMIQANPQLATFQPLEKVSSLLSDPNERPDLKRVVSDNPSIIGRRSSDVEQLTIVNGKRRTSQGEEPDDFVQKQSYTFIPEDPRAYYKRLVELVLKAQRNELPEEEGDDDSLFLERSRKLLGECAFRWRVHSASRLSLLLDVVKQLYDDEILDINDVREAVAMADSGWPYSSWPVADKYLLARVLVSLHDTLLRDLYNVLQTVFDSKPLNPQPILIILNRYIYENALFSETERDTTNYLSDLESGIRNRAREIYQDRRGKFFIAREITLINVHDFIQTFITDLERLHKRFKEPILGKVDILTIGADVYIPLVFRDVETVLSALIEKAESENEELSTEDMFAVYRQIREAWNLHRQITRKELSFGIQSFFAPAVMKWLEITDAQTISWVERAVRGDTFKPENDELKQSSSAMDLFQFISQAVDFLQKLEWPDPVQNAKFATRLAGTIDKAIGQYCMMMEHGFSDEMALQEEMTNKKSGGAQEGWMGRIRGAISGDEKPEPFQFRPQSLVRLNNIQFCLLKLDALQNNINVDALAAILERHAPPTSKREEKQMYIFTIKIVSAEDLKPCDVNGLSDPYVVLTNEHGKRIAKTRTIWGDLNPRWEETFDVSTTGSLWLAATVWDRDKLVKNHDLCGRCYVKLDPNYFGDYLPRDLWMDLDTQGRLLLRVSMEGEKDDIQFYFGRAFRALKRAENDMTRRIVETMTTYSRHCLSTSVIRALLSTSSTQKISNWISRTRSSMPVAPAKPPLTDEDLEKAIHPLLDYYDSNFAILDESLSKVASVILMGKLWKAVLSMFEDLLLPPLSDKPSRMRQLSEPEVDIIYKWLIFLRNYFFAGGNGVPMDVLTSLKYNDILTIRFFYDESTDTLIQESMKISEAAIQRQEKRSSKPIPVSFSQPKSVLKYRSLGTIKLHKAKKRDAKQKDPNDDIILRLLRMRPGAEQYLRERFRQKNRLAAIAAAEGVLRGPRRQ